MEELREGIQQLGHAVAILTNELDRFRSLRKGETFVLDEDRAQFICDHLQKAGRANGDQSLANFAVDSMWEP